MTRWRRLLGAAMVLVCCAAGCARSVSGDAGAAFIAPSTAASPASTAASPVPTTRSLPSASVRTPVSPAPSTVAPSTSAPAVKWLLPAPSTAARKNNKFGNRIATVGQTYALTYTDSKQTVVRFVVDSIKLDGRCDNADKPANGHFLIISLRVQLGAITTAEADDDGIGFIPDDWTAFDAKDIAQVGTDQIGGECLTKSAFPFTDQLDPMVLTSGKVALDVSAKSGTVVLMNTLNGGWVYHYG